MCWTWLGVSTGRSPVRYACLCYSTASLSGPPRMSTASPVYCSALGHATGKVQNWLDDALPPAHARAGRAGVPGPGDSQLQHLAPLNRQLQGQTQLLIVQVVGKQL